jgi:hypothetical protein
MREAPIENEGTPIIGDAAPKLNQNLRRPRCAMPF